MSPVATRLPQPVHDKDDTHKAPGELELVRAFLSLHDHEPGDTTSLPPSLETVGWWLMSKDLLERTDRPPKDQDLAWALRVRSALTSKVWENMGEPRDPEANALLNRAAEETGVRVCFGCEEDEPIHVEATGVRGAVGRLLGTAFLAELDGTWDRLRVCHERTCLAVFYDGSKNHSGKWCSMSTCGNRNKVRAFRERQAAG